MNKEIEELARYIHANCITHDTRFTEDCRAIAQDLYSANYRRQKVGEWTRVEVGSSKGYGQVYYQHKDCEINATQLFPSPYHFCPNCGAKMKGESDA